VIDQGLDAGMVAHQMERPLRFIPDGEGKHSDEFTHAGDPILFVKMEDHLRVRQGAETVPLLLQFLPQLPVVVDLAVADDLQGTVLVGQRLTSRRRQIDDAEAAMAQGNTRFPAALGVNSFIVGAPVDQGGQHPPHRLFIDLTVLPNHFAADTTHAPQAPRSLISSSAAVNTSSGVIASRQRGRAQ